MRAELALKLKPILEEIAKKNTTANLPGQPTVRNQTLGRLDKEVAKRSGSLEIIS